jgi:hypothetical protein
MSILFFNNFSALTNLYYFNLQVLLEQSTDQADVLSSGELMDTDCSQDKEDWYKMYIIHAYLYPNLLVLLEISQTVVMASSQ